MVLPLGVRIEPRPVAEGLLLGAGDLAEDLCPLRRDPQMGSRAGIAERLEAAFDLVRCQGCDLALRAEKSADITIMRM